MKMLALLAGLVFAQAGNTAAPAPTEDGLWYYRIGGAAPISLAPNPGKITTPIEGSITLGLGYSCGKFDPVLGVSNILNDIAAGADAMKTQMVNAATAAIAALPALILQRANPGLYDLFQNALLDAQARIELATKTCEQMEAEIAEGKNPYADWVTLSKGNDWKVQMGLGTDALTAKTAVETANGENGVPWIGESAGGVGQPVIRVIGDIAQAGYNISLNRPANATGTVPSGSNAPPLAQVWDSPQAASDWIVDVVGDKIVTTCDGCEKTSIPGNGLLLMYQRERTTIAPLMQALVSGSVTSTLANLDEVSAPGTAITRQVIEAVQSTPRTEQGLIMGRLVDEIAAARTVEKALLARRVILTGRQVPEVQAVDDAMSETNRAMTELEQEIENLLFETRVRREMVSETVTVLLEWDAGRREQSRLRPGVPLEDSQPLEKGRVQP
jgi:integrating conjugative element protein (TIGR03755 family)